MVSLSLPSLLDLSSIRIAYLMWTRHDVTKCCLVEEDWKNLQRVVLAEVQSLPLPQRLKSPILMHVKPAGEHLLLLLSLWLSKTQPMNSQKWLPSDMFYECLITNGDGLINHRKTAEQILNSRLLHSVFAFRLACINFLEVEVLKLWPHVMQYFLTKIALQGEYSHEINDKFSSLKLNEAAGSHNCPILHPSIDLKEYFSFECDNYSLTMEPHEVLFWISWCLSKQTGTDLQSMPKFIKSEIWHELILDSAMDSGNFAYFNYYKNYRTNTITYDYEEIFRKFWLLEADSSRTSFVFFYMMLNSETRLELFQKCPRETMSHFLHWPLSVTFVEKTEEIWNLVPDHHKRWVVLKIFSLLFEGNSTLIRLLHDIPDHWHNLSDYSLIYHVENPGLQVNEYIVSIFIGLWKVSPRSFKYRILNSIVFPSIQRYYNRDFGLNFIKSGLKQKLLILFHTNGEAILELYKGENMIESLRKIVAKYLPEDFSERWIPILHGEISGFTEDVPSQRVFKYIWPTNNSIMTTTMPKYEIREKFRNFVKEYLLLSSANNSSFFLSLK